MKKNSGFWQSLEKYSWKVARRSPLPWQWIGVGMVLVVTLSSLLNVKNSTVGARELREVIETAAERGDYETARKLFDRYQTIDDRFKVLGAETELEDKVYPERVVERRIAELEQKLKEYPGDREIYLSLAGLYGELGNKDLSGEYLEKARVLDPNNVEF